MKFKGKSFIAIVLSPEAPYADWFQEVDRIIERSPGFFIDRPIILDVRGTKIPIEELEHVLDELKQRSVRVMGIDGIAGTRLKDGMPPSFSGGRLTATVDVPEPTGGRGGPADTDGDADAGGKVVKQAAKKSATANAPAPQKEKVAAPRKKVDVVPSLEQPGGALPEDGKSIVISEPVRSGQSILHPDGDVTVIGSVSSGAEIIAGGSIHVYGALRVACAGRCLGQGQRPDLLFKTGRGTCVHQRTLQGRRRFRRHLAQCAGPDPVRE